MESLKNRLLSKVKVSAETGCWDWMAAKVWNGYGQIFVNRRAQYAHRVSYELHCKPIPEGLHVLHRCDNRGCVNPEHLFLGTNADNVADRVSKGRNSVVRLRGPANGQTKLTEADVLAIRASSGIFQRNLAAQYGVSQQTISDIRSGRYWAHLTECR